MYFSKSRFKGTNIHYKILMCITSRLQTLQVIEGQDGGRSKERSRTPESLHSLDGSNEKPASKGKILLGCFFSFHLLFCTKFPVLLITK